MMSSDDGYSEEVCETGARADSASPPDQHIARVLHSILGSLQRLEQRMLSVEENQKRMMKDNEIFFRTMKTSDSTNGSEVGDSPGGPSGCLNTSDHLVSDQGFAKTYIEPSRNTDKLRIDDAYDQQSSMHYDDSGFQDEENATSESDSSAIIPKDVLINITETQNDGINHTSTYTSSGKHSSEKGLDNKELVCEERVRTQQQREEDEALMGIVEAHIIPETRTIFKSSETSGVLPPSQPADDSEITTRDGTSSSIHSQSGICAQNRGPLDTHQSSGASGEDVQPEHVTLDNRTRLEVVEDNRTRSEVVKDNRTRSEVVKDNRTRSEVFGDNLTRSEVVEDNLTRSEVVEDNLTRSEVVEDNRSRPEVVKDNLTRSEVIEDNQTRSEVVEEWIIPCHVQPLGLAHGTHRAASVSTDLTEMAQMTGIVDLGKVAERTASESVDEVTAGTIGISEVDRLLAEDGEGTCDGRDEAETRSVSMPCSTSQGETEAEILLKRHWLMLTALDPEHLRHIFTQPYLKPHLGAMGDLLQQILRHKQDHLHQLLWKAIAGISPSVFCEAFGQNPDRLERDFIISEFSSKLKETIQNMKSSQADKIGDRSIQLDTDYIQLRVFGGKRSKDSSALSTKTEKIHNWSSDDSDSDSESDVVMVDSKVHAREELLAEETDWELPYIHQQREERQEDMPVTEVLVEEAVPLMVLVKGRPGVGKTTTCQWLHRKWALGEFANRFSMFFVIHIRHLIHIKDQEMTLFALLSNYCLAVHKTGGLKGYMGPWLEFNEKNILLAIDGIDEMPDFADCLRSPCEVTSLHQHARPLHLIANILKRTLLPSATVILFSRGFTLLQEIRFDRMVEIKGLSQTGVIQFVKNFAPKNRVEDIQNILWRNPLLMSVCSVTVYCMLICSALADDITLPGLDLRTYTRIYSFIIMHYLQRSDARDGLRDGDSVGLRYSSLLTTLASLAQTSFIQRPVKMIFSGRDLQLAEVNMKEVVRTGLMAVDSDVPHDAFSPDDQVTIASYLHLSIQEFLASAGVTQLNPQDLQAFISTELQRGQFEMALLFCFGQVFDRESRNVKQVHDALGRKNKMSALGFMSPWKPKEEVLTKIFKSILESGDESDDYVRLAVLAHESQSPVLAALCAGGIMEEAAMEFSNYLMTVVDMMSVMFVVNHSRNLKELRIQRCGVDAACVRLMEEFLSTTKMLKTLYLAENDIGDDGVAQLCQILNRNKSLKHLCLNYNHIGDSGMEALAGYIVTNNSLRSLEVAGNNFSDTGLALLVSVIGQKTSFKTLNICNNRFITDGSTRHLQNLQNHPPKGFYLRMDKTRSSISPGRQAVRGADFGSGSFW